jgi:hypothetical protein
MLSKFVKINGIYDILSALSILKMINIPILETIHLQMFHSDTNIINDPVFERFLAYWIFTYGIFRIRYNIFVPYSYYIEALFVANECLVHETIVFEKGMFVVVSSLILGYLTQNDLKNYY